MKYKGYIQKMRAAVLAVGMLVAGVVCWGQETQTYMPVNIDDITASSSSRNVGNLTDGNSGTVWTSSNSNGGGWGEQTDINPYLILDLGSVQNVDIVNISFSGSRPEDMTISYSNNGNSNWQEISYSGNIDNDSEFELREGISTRYIRLRFERSGQGRDYNAVSISELFPAESISCSDITIVHKQGQWYGQSYQSSYPRTEVADLYGNDTFDENGGWTTTDFGDQMQNTHEYRVVIYMNPGQTRTLTLPGNMSSSHLSMYNYQRWYDYETDGLMNDLRVLDTDANNNVLSFQFANGIVGGTFIPEVQRQNLSYDYDKAIVQVEFTMPRNGKDVYYVACDQSNYTDVTLPTNGTEMYEPTLSQRAIFVIRNASVIKNRIAELEDDEYLENYTIHFPTKRISTNTVEQVALSMPAQNYFCEGENGEAAGALSYEIEYPSEQNNTNFLGRGNRYNDNGISQGEKTSIIGDDRIVPFTYESDINDGDIAYINVFKDVDGRKNIARFTLVFDKNTEGLTRSEVENMDRNDGLYFRTNDYMEDQNYELLTKMNLDYENVSLMDNAEYFPYPMSWTYSSYGFYTDVNDKSGVPQWGEYAITKDFPWANDNSTVYQSLNPDGYHLYVDANERPGTICVLPFRESLCSGAMLYVTAWIANMSSDNNPADGNLQCDASVIFVLKGIKADDTEDIIYRQASGQIPFGEWRQLYFTYPSGNNDYVRYSLQIENNSAHTRGADFCIDDIRVYMNPLDVEGHTVEPVCASDAEASVELSLDYDLLLNRLGMEKTQGQGTTRIGYYSFLNKSVYDQTYDETEDNYVEAFTKAVVHGSGVYNLTNEYYGSITFSSNPSANNGQNGMANLENGALTFISEVSTNSSDEGAITLMPGEEYYIVFNASTFNPDAINSLEALAQAYAFNTRCTVKGEFTVDGPLIVRVNGSLTTDADIPCIGQIPHVEVQMKDDDGEIVEGAVFDWYFGTLDEFNQKGTNDRSLHEMLEAFRHFYPDATSIGDNVIAQSEGSFTLTDDDIAYIKQMNEEVPEGGQNPRLTLSASSDLLIRLRSDVTNIVLIPVGEAVGDTEKICWEPTQIVLYAQDGAPTLSVGYEGISYPTYAVGTGVSVRMDLDQMNTIKSGNTPLSVPVREPKLNGAGTTLVPVENDGVAYLAYTDDPNMEDNVGTGFDYEIGTINDFQINSSLEQNYVHFNFNSDFTAREGYRYFVTFRFRTTQQTGTGDGAEPCYGNAVVPILIVPKYEVWIGGDDGNWNSDANWRRADRDELHKGSDYITNEQNGDNGFVPIFSTKIIIPSENNQIQLYTPERRIGNDSRIWDLTQGKEGMTIGEASNNIEYDLVMYATNSTQNPTPTVYSVRPYYTNVCEQIHFAPGATMYHQERLTSYQKAWVEFEMTESEPYWMSSPLKDVYAGDMYAPKGTGRQETELFEPIEYNETDYDRWGPAFYQKAWNSAVDYSTDATGSEEHVESVAVVQSNWSIEYNDVTVPYSEGKGFYSRVEEISGEKGRALVRLPKAGTHYTYYEAPTTTRALNDVSERTDAGKLILDNTTTDKQVSVSLASVNGDDTHYLIGNPFMSYLNMSTFLSANSNVLESKYWILEEGSTTAAVGTPDVEDWESSAETGGFIKPMTAFFVEKNKEATGNAVVFTPAMMATKAEVNAGGTTRAYTASNPQLTLTATSSQGKSRAAVVQKSDASNQYESDKDAVTLLDSELDAPTVYTVAGNYAAAVNAIHDYKNVPLGVYADADEEVELTIEGASQLVEPLYLYDAVTRSTTPIESDSYTLNLQGSSHGRYFLTTDEGITVESDIRIYSPADGQLIIASTPSDKLKHVQVYDLSGRVVDSRQNIGMTTCQISVPGGIYIIRAESEHGEAQAKLKVR